MVYIKSLNKNIFPLYIKPLEDELFSSWFCRLSINHGIKPQSFILNYLENYPILARDIDFFAPSRLISFFEQHTPLSQKDIMNLFLKRYAGITYETEQGYNNILRLGIIHRKRKRYGLMVCPSCLTRSDYYKCGCRLQSSILCTICKRYLEDRCPKCKSPIMFHRVNIDTNSSIMHFKPLYLCSECKYDLRETPLVSHPTEKDLRYQRYINETINNGHNDCCMYSFSYLKVLVMLAQKIRSQRGKNRFRDIIIYYYPLLKDLGSGNEKSEIYYWDVNERRRILPFSFYLLQDKVLLNKLMIEGNVHKSYLDPENQFPYWFIKRFLGSE